MANPGSKIPTSLMLVKDSLDARGERLELRERRGRKVYTEVESSYELQDQYRVNE